MASTNYGQDVVALGVAERQAAELFEPEGRVFGFSAASLAPQSRTLSEGMLRCNCHLLEFKTQSRLPHPDKSGFAMTYDILDSGSRFACPE